LPSRHSRNFQIFKSLDDLVLRPWSTTGLTAKTQPNPTQLGSAAEAEAARAAGLDYVHIPVTTTGMTEQDSRLLKETIEQAPGPVVAHCRSGARSFYLWVLSGDLDQLSDQELLAEATELGVDTNAARTWLAAHRNSSGGDKK
jgi:uncharacterized protein (TIGR01244 family)